MPLETWNLLFYGALIVLVLCVLVQTFGGFTSNKYYHAYHKDELIKKTRNVNSINGLYFTSGETLRFIKKYVLCRTSRDKYVITSFNKRYNYITFFVLCYKNSKKPFKVLKYSESNTELASKVISVPYSTKKVNIVISQVDDKVINYNAIMPLSKAKINLNAWLMFLTTLSFTFVLRHLVFALSAFNFNILNKITESAYNATMTNLLLSKENYGLIALSIVFSILVGIKAKTSYKKKSKKVVNGGAVEYDFSE